MDHHYHAILLCLQEQCILQVGKKDNMLFNPLSNVEILVSSVQKFLSFNTKFRIETRVKCHRVTSS